MEHIAIGLLAHVDAGKTTLSEALLYEGGYLKNLGRVDKQNTFLDTYEMEKKRGITIFSKQAILPYEEKVFTLLDTPGHIDFSAEMERTLQVLDYAILVISGVEGVQSHTKTLWDLLQNYHIPVFIFVNKMDRQMRTKQELMCHIKSTLGNECILCKGLNSIQQEEEIATANEVLLEQYLAWGICKKETIQEAIEQRQIIPVSFGSALKATGVKEFLQLIAQYSQPIKKTKNFSARVFKILRDDKGNKLTYLKILGGSLKNKDIIEEEKVNEIRIYSGEKYETIGEVTVGQICAIVGPKNLRIGMGIGDCSKDSNYKIEAALTYEIKSNLDNTILFQNLKKLEEEEPLYHFEFDSALQQIKVAVMGEVQLEILQEEIKNRFQSEITFGPGKILYKETIENTVEGVGHFEPLKHYAEVHLLMEPLAYNSGLVFATNCREEILGKQWQNLVLSHLQEKEHKGVLTGSPITDMKITLISGKAHLKHTEGGDFRQAVYRAVRQGLMEAKSKLLEPYIKYELEIPEQYVGKAMVDLKQKGGTIQEPMYKEQKVLLQGKLPYLEGVNYQKEVIAYTKGEGIFSMQYAGYFICHKEQEIMEQLAYDPMADVDHTPNSVFCAKGSGYTVQWDEVKQYMHLECRTEHNYLAPTMSNSTHKKIDLSIGTEEVDAILAKTYGANKKIKYNTHLVKKIAKKEISFEPSKPVLNLQQVLVIDGYNMIFGCAQLKELGHTNMDGARKMLEHMASNYQAAKENSVVIVYDAYRVVGTSQREQQLDEIQIIYTKEGETADQFIEKYVHINAKKYNITVATSDRLEQVIVQGQGGNIISVVECIDEFYRVKELQIEQFQKNNQVEKNYMITEARLK